MVLCPAVVKAKVIGVNLDAQKLSLGLRPSYFEGEDSVAEGTDVDADQIIKDVDEEAFEVAAELESSDEDIEVGESFLLSFAKCHKTAGVFSKCLTGRPYIQHSMLACMHFVLPENFQLLHHNTLPHPQPSSGQSIVSWVQACALMTWSKMQHSMKA